MNNMANQASGQLHSTFFIMTKLNLLSGDQMVKDSLLESLQQLGLAYVDLFLIHDPSPHQTEDRLKDYDGAGER